MKTVVVYVASPSWNINLYTSIFSLVVSRTSFDHIQIFSVGGDMPLIRKLNVPISINIVNNKSEEYFQQNKTYITKVKADNVIYLDADTIVMRKIDRVYRYSDNLVLARPDSSYEKGKHFCKNVWSNILKKHGSKYGPFFNSGFVVFKENSNRLIKDVWEEVLIEERKKLIQEGNDDLPNRSTTEQLSFSVSALKSIEKVEEMSKYDHQYGWVEGPDSVNEDTVVYHTGSRGGRHMKYASYLSKEFNLPFHKPVISSFKNPLFLQLQGYKLGYRLKHFFSPPGG